jgi:hypothetical protein
MAVLVKPNGPFGTAYMAAIAPFRHLMVYPPAIREFGPDLAGAQRRSGTGERLAGFMVVPRSAC